MSKLPTFNHCPEDGTVTVTHHNYAIRDYAEIRSGQLTALLAVLGACSLEGGDLDVVTAQGLAEELAREVSGLVELFTRSNNCLEACHE
jgi:hypothetical protein